MNEGVKSFEWLLGGQLIGAEESAKLRDALLWLYENDTGDPWELWTDIGGEG